MSQTNKSDIELCMQITKNLESLQNDFKALYTMNHELVKTLNRMTSEMSEMSASIADIMERIDKNNHNSK